MRAWRRVMLALALSIAGVPGSADVGSAGPRIGAPPALEAGQHAAAAPVLEVFVREGCPHCADAARDELARLFLGAGIWPPGVPAFVVGGRMLVGFDDEAHAGAALRELIDGAARPADQVESALFGTLSASRLGLPLFTLAVGLLDGFNPCATWVLLFLLSLLVRLRDRRRMAERVHGGRHVGCAALGARRSRDRDRRGQRQGLRRDGAQVLAVDLLSSAVMPALGLVMLLRPQWLL